MFGLVIGLIAGLSSGFFLGHLFNVSAFYNGSIRITDYGVDLDIVDSKRLDTQKYIILSVKNSSSHK